MNTISFKARESKKSYLQKIDKIKRHIKRGDIYEINYCQEFFNNNVLISPQNIFYQLNKLTKSPFASFIKNDKTSVMGFSPERYLSKNNSSVAVKFSEGNVLTIEPGCYIRPSDNVPKEFWGIGVRIEDDVLVTSDGYDVLSKNAPKEINELEAIIGTSSA